MVFPATLLMAAAGCAQSPTWSHETIESGLACDGVALAAAGDNLHVVSVDTTDRALDYATRDSDGSWHVAALTTTRNDVYTASMAVASDGQRHVAFYDGGLDGGSITYGTAMGGDAWALDTVAEGVATGPRTRAAIALDDAGRPHILASLQLELVHATRDASGAWQTSVVTTSGIPNAIAVDPSGGVHVTYYDDGIWHATAGDEGMWTSTLVDERGAHSALAIDASGAVHVVYDLDTAVANEPALYHAVANAGGTWQPALIDDIPEYQSSMAIMSLSATAGDDGVLHATYELSNGELRYATSTAGEPWLVDVADEARGAAGDTAIAVDGGGGVHIAYCRDRALWYAQP